MARTIYDIQQMMLNKKAATAELNALEVLTNSEQTLTNASSTSKVSVWRLFIWVVAYAIWVHEQIMFANAANSRPQNLPNFIANVYNFHDGLPLVFKDGQFTYDLSNVTNADALKIVNRVAVLESEDGELVVKIAHDNNGNLEPLTSEQATRLLFYLGQMKVPGVRIRLINKEADLLKISLNVYVDPLLIDLATGQKLNSGEPLVPVQEAINLYLTQLEFNGAFLANKLERSIESQEGITLCEIVSLQHRYDAFPFTDFTTFKVPQAGYFKIEPNDLTINYLPNVLVNT